MNPATPTVRFTRARHALGIASILALAACASSPPPQSASLATAVNDEMRQGNAALGEELQRAPGGSL
jgi:hypothetical protein